MVVGKILLALKRVSFEHVYSSKAFHWQYCQCTYVHASRVCTHDLKNINMYAQHEIHQRIHNSFSRNVFFFIHNITCNLSNKHLNQCQWRKALEAPEAHEALLHCGWSLSSQPSYSKSYIYGQYNSIQYMSLLYRKDSNKIIVGTVTNLSFLSFRTNSYVVTTLSTHF